MFCRKCGRKIINREMRCRFCGEPLDTAGICGGFRGLVHTKQLSLTHDDTEYSDNWTGPGVRFENIISNTEMEGSRSSDVRPESGGESVSGRSLLAEENSFDSRIGEFSRNMEAQERFSSQLQDEILAGSPQEEIPADEPQEQTLAGGQQKQILAGSPQEEIPADEPQEQTLVGSPQENQENPGEKRRLLFPLKVPVVAVCSCIAAAAVIALVFFPGLLTRPDKRTEIPDSQIAENENLSAGRADNNSIPDNNEADTSPAHLLPNSDEITASEAYTAGEMAQTAKTGTEAAEENSLVAATAETASTTAEKTTKDDNTDEKEAKDKKDTGSAAETGTENTPEEDAPEGNNPVNAPAKEKDEGNSVYVRRIYAGTDYEQESLKDFLKENNLSEEVQEEQNSGQSISIETLPGSSTLRRIEKVEYRSASEDADEDGTGQKRTSLEYDYLSEEDGAPKQLKTKTVTEKVGGKERSLFITYGYNNAGWGQSLTVEETYSSKDSGFKAEGFSKDKKTLYTYEYNNYYKEYNLVRKEYSEKDEPARGPGGALAVEYSGYEKSMDAEDEYYISETYVTGYITNPSGETVRQKGSIRIGQSSFDEVRYYYDGSTYRLKKLRYFKEGQKVIGPQGFYSMKCITADSLCSRIEKYYDSRKNPVAIRGDEIFQSWQDLYLLNESEFKILFFRKDIQD